LEEAQVGSVDPSGLKVTGTLVWYYFVCRRQVWLLGHGVEPDSEDDNIQIGRHVQETAYARQKKEVSLERAKLDILDTPGGDVVVAEVKKSSRHIESARMQLAFYLRELEAKGIDARGELRFPLERRVEPVELTDRLRQALDETERAVTMILRLPAPPPARKVRWCRRCGYAELCWA